MRSPAAGLGPSTGRAGSIVSSSLSTRPPAVPSGGSTSRTSGAAAAVGPRSPTAMAAPRQARADFRNRARARAPGHGPPAPCAGCAGRARPACRGRASAAVRELLSTGPQTPEWPTTRHPATGGTRPRRFRARVRSDESSRPKAGPWDFHSHPRTARSTRGKRPPKVPCSYGRILYKSGCCGGAMYGSCRSNCTSRC